MDSDHRAAIDAVLSQARPFETPCGDGSMVWRRWGQGRPVVLLHGGSGSWMHWIRTIPALSPHYTVWAPDQPGFGDSAVPPQPVTPDSYAVLVKEGLDALPQRLESFDIVGFSMGSGVGTRIARLVDGRVRHLVLAGANFVLGPRKPRGELISARRIKDLAERTRAFRHNLGVMMIAHERNRDDFAVELYGFDAMKRRLKWLSFSNAEMMHATLPHVKLQGRLCVISGADDQLIGHDPARQAEAIRSAWPGAGYVTVPGAGHWVMYEGAEGFNRELLRALA